MTSTLESSVSIIEDALDAILSVKRIEADKFVKALSDAGSLREGRCFIEEVCGDTLVIGPSRGHAGDLVRYLRTHMLREVVRDGLNVVFLGNYVDGGHQSMEMLYLVALLMLHLPGVVVPLIGRHEMFYPFPPGDFGSLRGELRLLSSQYEIPIQILEKVVKDFFKKLPVACVVNKYFFCSSSGFASGYPLVSDIMRETSQSCLSEFVQNQPMDEEEEKLSAGLAFVGSRTENGKCLRYTFKALSNFLARNNMYTHIGGLEYHIYRPEFENFARSNRYGESTYFPGWVLGRMRHELRVPAYIMIFSAPYFCGINQNCGCVVVIKGYVLELRQFGMYVNRPLIMPGEEDHAFSWSQRILERALHTILNGVLCAEICKVMGEESGLVERVPNDRIQKTKLMYRRMCQLLKCHSMPMPH